MAKISKATGGTVQTILGAIVGGVGAKILTNALPIENNLVKALIPLGGGFFLANQKNPMLKGVGIGMAVTGGTALVSALIPGIGQSMDLNTIEAPEVPETVFIEEPEDGLSDPANQSILSDPANQSILSAAEVDQSILSEMPGGEELNGVPDFAGYEANF
jgi:hypothetical protein